MNHLLYSLLLHLINNMMDYMTTLIHCHIPVPRLNTSLLHYCFHRLSRLNFHRYFLHLIRRYFHRTILLSFRRCFHLMMLRMIHSFDMNRLLYSPLLHLINNRMDYMTTLVHCHIPVLRLNTSLLQDRKSVV